MSIHEIPAVDLASEESDLLRAQIKHLLTIYPFVSPTALQMGIGPGTKPSVWKPVLRDMVEKGIVCEDHVTLTTPKGRENSYKILHLKHNSYSQTSYNEPANSTPEGESLSESQDIPNVA